MLLTARLRGPLAPREPQRQLVTYSEDCVDRPGGLDSAERQVGPFGELLREQPPLPVQGWGISVIRSGDDCAIGANRPCTFSHEGS